VVGKCNFSRFMINHLQTLLGRTEEDMTSSYGIRNMRESSVHITVASIPINAIHSVIPHSLILHLYGYKH